MKGATKPSEKGGGRASGELEFLTPSYQMPSGLMGICRVCVFFTTPRGRYTYAHLIDKNIELQERSITSGVAELPIPRIRAMFSTPFWDGGECPGACLHFGVCTWHLQCGRPGFDPWVGKISWRRERLPTPVFWPGEFHGLHSPWVAKSQT